MTAVNIEGLDKPVNFPDSMSHDDIVKAIETDILPRIGPMGYMKTAGNAIAKGAAGVADSFANLPYNLVNLSKMITGGVATAAGHPEFAPDVSSPPSPVSALLNQTGITSPAREPINTTGRIIDFTGQVLGAGGRNPVGYARQSVPALLKNAAVDTGIGVSGGVGQELGQRAMGDVGGQIGGVLASGVPAFLSTMRNTNSANLRGALSGLTQEELDAAQELQRRSIAAGSPITGAEAINKTVGNIPSLQSIQRVVEQSSGGSPIISPMMNARPGNNTGVFDRTMAPLGGVVDPRMVASNMQQTAESVINKQRQAGNQQAKPFYDASVNSNAKIPASDWNNLTADPAISAALKSVKGNDLLGMANEPPGSMKWLDAARKHMDDVAASATTSGKNYEAANARNASSKINDALDTASPQYAMGRYITGGNMKYNVAPLENGPIGKIANTSGERSGATTTQFDALVNGDNTTPDQIRKTIAQLNMNNPNAARELAVQGLKNEFDSATQNLVSGPNQWGGAKFAKAVDTPKVQAYLESLPNGKQVYQGFRNMLDVFEAQGTRSAPGSLTSTNMQGQKEMTGVGVGVAADPAKWMQAMRDVYDNFRFGRNTAEMAKILTDPNSVAKMRKLAMLDPTSPSAWYLVSQLVSRDAK